MSNQSVWMGAGRGEGYPPLTQPMTCDALIVGGGITGITAAYLLTKAGKSVVLVEKGRLCEEQTSHTTAHISYPTDERLSDLISKFGESHAQAVWDAQAAAAEQIGRNAREEKLECELRDIPGYLYAAGDKHDPDEAKRLHDEAEKARELGFDTHFTEACPVTGQPAMVFANLKKFHPLRYALGLARAAANAGCRVFENTAVDEFGNEGKSAKCNGQTIVFQHVFLATHVPLQGNANTLGAALLQTKLAAYSTYAIGARLAGRTAPEALWWDTSDPYLYLRIDHGAEGAYAILGGEDHKTGQDLDVVDPYDNLIAKMHSLFPGAEVDRRWSGQVIETVDGLPYIGEYAGQYVATGYSGTGMTFGTLAAMMFRDHVLGLKNPWSDLLRVERKKLSGAWDYMKENKDYPYYLVKSLFMGGSDEPSKLVVGEGKIIRHEGKKVAAYRDEKGNVTLLSAICPHMGCVVNWNGLEKTWDCPCHGSRFNACGEVIGGPAESPLSPIK